MRGETRNSWYPHLTNPETGCSASLKPTVSRRHAVGVPKFGPETMAELVETPIFGVAVLLDPRQSRCPAFTDWPHPGPA
jgi:hypothetical protein